MKRQKIKELDLGRATEFVDRALEDADEAPRGTCEQVSVYMLAFKGCIKITKPEQYLPLFALYHADTGAESLRARDQLVCGNIRLVVRVAMGYRGRGLGLPDMIQEGVFGLMRAVDGFDPNDGATFSTYAFKGIRRLVVRAIHNSTHTRSYRMPVHQAELMGQVGRAYGELLKQNGKTPLQIEIYRHLKASGQKFAEKLSLAHVRDALQAIALGSEYRLDAPVSDDSDDSYGSVMVGAPPKTETVLEARRLYLEYHTAVEKIAVAVSQFPMRSATILRLRLGLGEFEKLTLEEIGERYELTRQRIEQILARDVPKLEEMLETDIGRIEEIVEMEQELEVLAHAA